MALTFDDIDTPTRKGALTFDDIEPQKEVYDDPIPSIPFGDLAAGAIRGAGSIGATILAPWDIGKDIVAGKGLSLESNRQRRADIDYGLQAMGANPESTSYGIGKFGAEVAGTMGAGGAIANTLRSLVPQATRLAPAIEAWGMTAPRATGSSRLADAGYRVAGGAIPGAAAAGMVDPENAAIGLGVGAAIPFAAPIAGRTIDALATKVQQLYGGAQGQAIDYLRKTFPENWQDVANRLKDLKQFLPMERPTIAAAAPEFSGKLSAIEQRARSSPEMADDFVRRDAANQAARREAAQRRADPLETVTQARSDVASPLYAAAKAEQFPIDDTLRTIMQGPEVNRLIGQMQNSMRQGQVNQLVSGGNPLPTIIGKKPAPVTDYVNEWAVPVGATPEKIQIEAVERLKRAIDGELNAFNKRAPSPLGLGDINAEQFVTARQQLTNWINNASPAMAEARREFASRSPQVNQAQFFNDVASALDRPLTAEGLTQLDTMVKNLPKAFTKSTGIARYQNPEEVLASMSPLGRRTLEGIHQSGQREVAGARASTGESSLPNMEGVLSKIEHAVPTWFSPAITAVRNIAKRIGIDTDDAAMELINRAAIDPKAFARLIEMTPPAQRSEVMNGIRRYATTNEAKAFSSTIPIITTTQ